MANRMCKSLLQSAEDVLVGGKRTSVDRMRKASKVGRSRSRLAKAHTHRPGSDSSSLSTGAELEKRKGCPGWWAVDEEEWGWA